MKLKKQEIADRLAVVAALLRSNEQIEGCERRGMELIVSDCWGALMEVT